MHSSADDKRQLHFDVRNGLAAKEDLWAAEHELAVEDPARHGEGTPHHAMVQQGKCAELVMWWIHHLVSCI